MVKASTKFKCINNRLHRNRLTIGKVYETISDMNYFIKIIDDNGDVGDYQPFYFEEVNMGFASETISGSTK